LADTLRLCLHIVVNVFRTKYNLNQISHDTAIGLVRRTMSLGVDIKEVLGIVCWVCRVYLQYCGFIFLCQTCCRD